MNKLILVVLVLVLTGCETQQAKNVKSQDSTKIIDSIMKAAERPDSEETSPSLAEERARIIKTYNDVQTIDTLLLSGKDSLHFHLKYYCLKDSKLIIPKRYEFDSKPEKPFATHEFATDVVLVSNKDTVLNKRFKLSDFNPYYNDPFEGGIKRYGSIIDLPSLQTESLGAGVINLNYPIAIPTTDLGMNVLLSIRKDGKFRITGDR